MPNIFRPLPFNWPAAIRRLLEPLVFLVDLKLFTLPLSLRNFNDAYGTPLWHLQLPATTLSVIPIILFYIVAQKRIVNAMALSGLKG